MSAQLTVHNAQVTTATVQIKTLTISGKQVTLAVFRQLLLEPLIDEDGNLNGTPWGTVNYCPPRCGGAGRHLHVVWQRGDELLRATVRLDWGAWFYSEGCDGFAQAAYCANHHRLPAGFDRRRDPAEPGEYCTGFVVDGLNCVAGGEPRSPGKWDRAGKPVPHECKSNLDEARQWLAEDVASELARRARVRAHWEALNDRQQFPQLFIAV